MRHNLSMMITDTDAVIVAAAAAAAHAGDPHAAEAAAAEALAGLSAEDLTAIAVQAALRGISPPSSRWPGSATGSPASRRCWPTATRTSGRWRSRSRRCGRRPGASGPTSGGASRRPSGGGAMRPWARLCGVELDVLHIVVATYAGTRCAWAWASTLDGALSGGGQQSAADMEGMTERDVMTLHGARAAHARQWLESDDQPAVGTGAIADLEVYLERVIGRAAEWSARPRIGDERAARPREAQRAIATAAIAVQRAWDGAGGKDARRPWHEAARQLSRALAIVDAAVAQGRAMEDMRRGEGR